MRDVLAHIETTGLLFPGDLLDQLRETTSGVAGARISSSSWSPSSSISGSWLPGSRPEGAGSSSDLPAMESGTLLPKTASFHVPASAIRFSRDSLGAMSNSGAEDEEAFSSELSSASAEDNEGEKTEGQVGSGEEDFAVRVQKANSRDPVKATLLRSANQGPSAHHVHSASVDFQVASGGPRQSLRSLYPSNNTRSYSLTAASGGPPPPPPPPLPQSLHEDREVEEMCLLHRGASTASPPTPPVSPSLIPTVCRSDGRVSFCWATAAPPPLLFFHPRLIQRLLGIVSPLPRALFLS